MSQANKVIDSHDRTPFFMWDFSTRRIDGFNGDSSPPLLIEGEWDVLGSNSWKQFLFADCERLESTDFFWS